MAPLATVGILSIGDMGMGVAKLLLASGFRVVTSVEGRSEDTKARVTRASIEALTSDTDLVMACDYILSIVPPRDAVATATRVSVAASSLTSPKSTPLYYLDLNAISPRSARSIAALFDTSNAAKASSPTTEIVMVDGGIIGSPPSLKNPPENEIRRVSNSTTTPPDAHAWNRPSVPTSGPHKLADAPISGSDLTEALNVRHIDSKIGAASGLKCCFATTTKGATALCIQAFTTASRMGVLAELEQEMSSRIPAMFKFAQGMTHVPPKAYRWVKEMEEIAVTHSEDGGFDGGEGIGVGHGIFDAIAEVYRTVADDTILGEEKTERRKRGLSTEDVAACMAEGLAAKKVKRDNTA